MFNLSRMRLKKRLVTGFVMVSVVASIAAVVGIIAMMVVSNRYSYALTNYGFSQGDIGKGASAFAEVRSSTRAAIGYEDEQQISNTIQTHDQKRQSFEEYMQVMQLTLTSDEEWAAYNRAAAALETYWEIDSRVLELGSTTDAVRSMEAQNMAYRELDPVYDEVYAGLEQLMNVNVEKGNELSGSLTVLSAILQALMIAVIILGAGIGITLGNYIAKGIAVPIGRLSERLRTFSEGDLGMPFPEIDTQDEVADMIREAKSMAENLNLIITDAGGLMGEMAKGNYAIGTKMEDRYVGDFAALKDAMRQMNRQMNDALSRIDDAASQVSAGSGNLAQSAQALAEGATDQAASVQELQATITSLTENVQRTAEHAEKSYQQAQQYAEEAEHSHGEMEAMVTAMERINETSERIEHIISEIEDIASQTNLLSLNAAIEAARAGDAGRGFAVVAEQIRKLAEQSAQSAVDTRKLIEGSLQEIEQGNRAAEGAAVSIEEVVKGVREIAESSRNLSSITQQQTTAMVQVEQTVNQISGVIQSNSAAAEESSATSEELSAQATTMSDLVGRFTLRAR